jgi:ribosomal protein L29
MNTQEKINKVRKELLDMRFLKAQKKNFNSYKYKMTRKSLAKLLTGINK